MLLFISEISWSHFILFFPFSHSCSSNTHTHKRKKQRDKRLHGLTSFFRDVNYIATVLTCIGSLENLGLSSALTLVVLPASHLLKIFKTELQKLHSAGRYHLSCYFTLSCKATQISFSVFWEPQHKGWSHS